MERTAPANLSGVAAGGRSVWGSGLVSHADAERICMPPHQSGVVGRERVWKQKPRAGAACSSCKGKKKTNSERRCNADDEAFPRAAPSHYSS